MSRLRKELSILPRVGTVLTLLIAGTAAACIFLFADEPPPVRVAIGTLVSVIILAYGLLVCYVYADSKRRGMRPVLWTLVAALVPNAIGFVAYFILRESILHPCNQCGTPARREFAFCPSCGSTLPRACPSCHKPVEPIWTHCAHCGANLGAPPPPAPTEPFTSGDDAER